jgi:hypothetical protein
MEAQDLLITKPPETPVRRSSSNESFIRVHPIPSRVSTPRSFSSRGSGICLTPDAIESINDKLAQARREGEIPTTTSSPLHTDVILEDYGYLIRLREARGDPSQPPPSAYTELLVDVAKKIKDRDSSFDEEELRRETVRRVESFVENVKHVENKRLFCDVNTPKTPKTPSTTKSLVDVETFSEEVLSIVGHAADQTLVDAAKPLLKTLGKQNKAYSHHVTAQKDLQEHLVSAMGAQQGLQEHLRSTMHTQQEIHERIHLTLETQQDLQEHLHHSVTNQQHLQDHYVSTQKHLQDHFVTSQKDLQDHFVTNQQHLQSSMGHQLDSINNLASTLSALMIPQAQATQASTENLTLVTGIVALLGQQVNTLPNIIQQTVHNTVQQEVCAAVQHVMQAQQEAMLSLLEERRKRPETPRSMQCSTDSGLSRRSRCVSRVRSLFRQKAC